MKLLMLLAVLCVLGVTNMNAQSSCKGSLGDPVLNETFGYLHQPLPGGKTTFEFVPGCPWRNQYTINDFLYGCGNPIRTWAKTTGDHTPYDSAGCYMLVNAEENSGTIYTDTLKELCGNTTYQFQAWITAVMTVYACNGQLGPMLPNIKFTLRTLSGSILAKDSTGKLLLVGDVEWKPYGFTIRTPPDVTTAIIDITIDPDWGCGSAFAIDDITFRPCGPNIDVTIDGTPGPEDVCADYTDSAHPFMMKAEYSPGFDDPVVQWQSSKDSGITWVDIPGETTLNYKVPHRLSGLILYRIAIAERGNINSLHCRITSNVIYTRIHPLAVHAPPKTLLGCLDKNFFFPPADLTALKVLWTGPNSYRSGDYNATIPGIQYSDTGLYKLKQTFYFECTSLDSFHINVFPSATVRALPGHPICEGMSENLSAMSYDTVSYKWIPSVGLSSSIIPNPVAWPKDSTQYKVLITNRFGCQDSAYVNVDVYRNAFADAGPDKIILIGDTARLNGVVKGTGINYYWSPSVLIDDDHTLMPYVYPAGVTKYTLNVQSTLGCGTASDDVVVKVYNDIYIPNAFTPNGDGHNDKFQVFKLDNYKLVRLMIYNRWGLPVFKTENSYNGWDGTINGTPQPPGAYVYRLELLSTAGKRIIKQGTLLLVR